MNRLVIYGAGGFGREVLRLARHSAGDAAIVFASDDREQIGTIINGIPVINGADLCAYDRCVLAISDPFLRRKLAARCPGFASLSAPFAAIYPDVQIGEGAIISDFCSVTADANTRIGRHFLMNTHSTVGHDCTIGDFVTLGPNASVNGNVVIEDDVYIGCGARIRNGTPDKPLVIRRGAVVGMGAIVTKDVPPGVTVVGNPARPLGPALIAA